MESGARFLSSVVSGYESGVLNEIDEKHQLREELEFL